MVHVALGKHLNSNGRHEFIQFVKTNHNHKPRTITNESKMEQKQNRTESIVMYANEIINNCYIARLSLNKIRIVIG